MENKQIIDDNQTNLRGTDREEYEIYKACAQDLGWIVKSYDEWLRS